MDLLADWSALAWETVILSEREPARAAHAMATVHLAMLDVVSFVEGGEAPRFLVRPPAPLGRSGAAAAAVAAHYVLSQTYPARRAALDTALERSLAGVADLNEKMNARVWGRHLGGIVHAARQPLLPATTKETPMSMTSLKFALALSVGLAAAFPAAAQTTTTTQERNRPMAKYLIERDLPGAGKLSATQLRDISRKSRSVLEGMGPKIQWVQSYVTEDKIYCVYIAESEEQIRKHAKEGGFPANRISRIGTLIDPTTAE